jgi:hypothetical protein
LRVFYEPEDIGFSLIYPSLPNILQNNSGEVLGEILVLNFTLQKPNVQALPIVATLRIMIVLWPLYTPTTNNWFTLNNERIFVLFLYGFRALSLCNDNNFYMNSHLIKMFFSLLMNLFFLHFLRFYHPLDHSFKEWEKVLLPWEEKWSLIMTLTMWQHRRKGDARWLSEGHRYNTY